MTYHQTPEEVEFTAQYPVRLWGHDYQPGDVLTVGLVRNWDEGEGIGEGEPWGYGSYPSRLVAELAGTVKPGHAHTCLSCGHEIEFDNFDCEEDEDHDYRLCDACARTGSDV